MKKLLFFLLLGGVVQAQNTGGLTHFPGGCSIVSSATVDIFRMPDTSTIYRTIVADQYGFYEPYLAHPGQYRFRLRVFGSNVWVGRQSFTPIVGLGGDSTSNAGRIIQNALDSLPATGGVIKLPPGVHLFDSNTVTISKSNVTIEAAGDNCILKYASNFNRYGITVADGTKNVILRGFLINGNKGNQVTGGGINVNGAAIRNVQIEKVHFINIQTLPVAFVNGASGNSVFSCVFDSAGDASIDADTAGIPIYTATNCKDNHYSYNTFRYWSGTAAVRIFNGCQRIWVDHNSFLSSDRGGASNRRGVFADSSAGQTRNTDITIERNDFFDIDENAIFCNFNNFTDINHNNTDSSGNHGIECNDDYSSVSDNNVRRSQGTAGIIFNNTIATGASNNHVSLSYGRGIYAFASTSDSVIGFYATGNECWNNSQSGATADPAIEVQGVDNNDATSGQLRNTTLTGNTCYDTQATHTQTYGISVAADAAPVKSDILVIVGNNLARNLTGAINDGSAGTNETIASNQLTPIP